MLKSKKNGIIFLDTVGSGFSYYASEICTSTEVWDVIWNNMMTWQRWRYDCIIKRERIKNYTNKNKYREERGE